MKKKILNLLGLAQKGGMVVSGEDAVTKLLQSEKAKYVFVAQDASGATLDKFKRKCFFYQVPLNDEFTSDELSLAIGRPRKIVALNNEGIVKSIKEITR